MKYLNFGIVAKVQNLIHILNNYSNLKLLNKIRLEVIGKQEFHFINLLELIYKKASKCALPWGEVNRFQRLSGDIDLKYDDDQPYIQIGMGSGKWGALGSFGARTYEGTKRIYGSSGYSFVAVVEFGEKVKAKSILAGGQS